MGRAIKQTSISKPKETPLTWRAVGCVMMAFIPAVSIFIGKLFVDYAVETKLRMPPQLMGIPHFPDILNKSAGLKPLLPMIRIPNLYAYIAVSLVLMLVISSLISLVYAIGYRVANPNRYGPMDEPPETRKIRKKTR
jgi:hypothetical protein